LPCNSISRPIQVDGFRTGIFKKFLEARNLDWNNELEVVY